VSLAIVAGSGLSGLASILQVEETISFEQIPGVGAATVAGHSGQVLQGRVDGRECQLVLGRRHFYEGDDRPIGRLIDFVKEHGATSLLVTSAVGALHRDLRVGEIVVVRDIIDLQNRETRAVHDEQRAHSRQARGMTIDARLVRLFEESATAARVPWQRGTSVCTSGPLYESMADVEFLQFAGATVATMSGAPEVTHANQIGLPAMSVAVVTNPCTGIDASVPSHSEVLEASAGAAIGLGRVIRQFVSEL
jgi:inosine/guanosine/xanthosine phosphorylase family protein